MAHEADVQGLGISVGERGEGAPVVMLAVDEQVVPIFISEDQAQSIKHALDGHPFERPLTHDLFVEMISEFGGAIDRVRVDDVREGTFLAKIDAEQYHGGERSTVVLDARPSDAIAIALRVGCPIEVAEAVLADAGRPAGEFETADE